MKIGWLLSCFCTWQSALGQVSDGFADGDFSLNPAWIGDDTKFEVVAQRLHLNDTSASGKAYLSTPSSAVADAEWRFSIEINANPSGSNYAFIYLVADQADVTAGLNGYMVRIGGVDDDISLLRQDGSTKTLIIDGVDGRVNTSLVQMEVKVTRDELGHWELSSRLMGDTDYSLEGSVQDVIHHTSQYFGIYCQYTSTRKDAFYFDDISVTGIPQPDTQRPQVIGISVLSETGLSVQFSEEVTLASAGTLANYVLPEPSITSATVGSDAVILTVQPALVNATDYVLSVHDIEDVAGNLLSDTALAFFYFEEVAAQWNDVVISELMPDPNPVKADLPEAEFVELYNRSEYTFDLQYWTLNGKSLPSYILRPQQYVILCPPDDSALFAPYGNVLPLSSWPALSNSGSKLVLQDRVNTTLDSLEYSADAVVGGISLERIREIAPCDQRMNLSLSLADRGGTPGQANTVTDSGADTQAPQLLSIQALNERQLQLLFDERVSDDQLSAAAVLLQPTLPIMQVQRDTADETTLWVSLSEALQHDATYSLTFLNAQDCYGNTQPTQTASFYYDNQPPAILEVIVSDTSSVQIVFTEKVDGIKKEYCRIDDEATSPTSLSLSEDSTLVNLHFPKSFADGWVHQLTLLSLQDSYGNLADSLIITFRYEQAIDTVVVISEYQLDVYLKSDVSSESVVVTENFEIDRAVGHPYASWVDEEQLHLIHWALQQPLTANQEHEVSINQLYDRQHQLLSTPIYRFYYDRRPPGLDSVVVIDERILWAYFDEALAPTEATQAIHYQLAGSDTKITNVILLENEKVVQLSLDTALVPEIEYELQVLGLSDLSGNLISSSRSKKFFYDHHPPRLLSWKIIHPYQLRLYFSEAVAASGSSTSDFRLKTAGSPDSLWVSRVRPEEMRLFFNNPLDFTIDTLTIDHIQDLRGNRLTQPIKASLIYPEAGLGQISVRSPTELQLDFTLAVDGTKMQETALYRLDQTRHPATVTSISDQPYALHVSFSQPFQPDATHQLAIEHLINAQGMVLAGVQDSFRYQTQIEYLETEAQAVLIHFSILLDSNSAVQIEHYQLDKEPPVAALWVDEQTVRLLFTRPFEPLTRYELAISGLQTVDKDVIPASMHTVGRGRSPSFNELLITEIMADPSPSVGLPEAEYLELYNASEELLSTAGLRLSDATSTALLPATLMLPGEYLILCSTTDKDALALHGKSIGVSQFPSLNSTGDQLYIRDAYGQQVFSVHYSQEWYNDAEKKQGGWSMEMIDPSRPCGERDNWTASVAKEGGTPGRENSVHQPNPDTRGPTITGAVALSDTVIRLSFSEKIDPSSYSQAQFVLSHGLKAEQVQWREDHKAVELSLSDALQTKVTYMVQLEQLADCSGNQISSTAVAFVLPEAAEWGDLLLSELLFYPRAGGVRFVEIYNASDKYINLLGWQLANLAGDSVVNRAGITLEDYLLDPQQHLAITENVTTLLGDYPAAPADHIGAVSGLPSLPSDAGILVLLSPSGERMQELAYDQQFHHPALTDARGVSLERIRWDAPVHDPHNWQSAASTVGYATPGYANSQAIQTAVSQAALSVEPRVFTPDQDGYQDYAQIHYQWTNAGNVANVLIFDSQGQKVKHLARNVLLSDTGFLRWDGTNDAQQIVPMGYYLIYFEVFHTNGKVSVLKEKVVVGKPL